MNRYGIISTASITERFVEGIRLAGDEVICAGSRDLDRAKSFSERLNIPKYYGSYNEVYEDVDINIVYIPVINNLHFECARDAILHHKNVVLEKPFVTNTDEAKKLYQLAKENDVFLFEGIKNVFVPSTQFVKNNLESIGKVYRIETRQGTKKPFPEGHWMYDIRFGGGAYFGSAAYVYHYLGYLFSYEISDLDGTYVPCENSDLSCEFSFRINDIEVNSVIDLSKDLKNNCTIYGDNGKIVIDTFWRSHHVDVYYNNGEHLEFNDSGNEFVYEIKHVQECLNKGLKNSPVISEYASISEVKNINYLYRKWKLID